MPFNKPTFTDKTSGLLSPERQRALRIFSILALGLPGCATVHKENMIQQNSEKPEKLEELLATYHVEFFGGHPKKLENFHLVKISEEKYEVAHPHLRAITKDRLYVDRLGNFLFSEIQLELDETHPEAKKLALLFPFGWQGRKLYVNQEGSLIRITKSPYQTKKDE